MRWRKLILIGAVILGVLEPGLATPIAAAGDSSSLYSFDLIETTAVSSTGGMMATAGDWISVSGSGAFDPIARTVRARGTFTHYTSGGKVMCQGTWTATGFTSFLSFGTNSDGQAGGVLSMVVTHHCTMGMTMTGIPMTVTSTVKAPAGSTYVQGVTVCDFTTPTGGKIVMQPEQ